MADCIYTIGKKLSLIAPALNLCDFDGNYTGLRLLHLSPCQYFECFENLDMDASDDIRPDTELTETEAEEIEVN